MRPKARISRESLWVVHQAHVVSLARRPFVFRNTIVPLIALVIVLDNTAFTNVLS